jgi:hypothetical protein
MAYQECERGFARARATRHMRRSTEGSQGRGSGFVSPACSFFYHAIARANTTQHTCVASAVVRWRNQCSPARVRVRPKCSITEIDESKCQQQMRVFDGLGGSTPVLMRRVSSASTGKTSAAPNAHIPHQSQQSQGGAACRGVSGLREITLQIGRPPHEPTSVNRLARECERHAQCEQSRMTRGRL